MDTSHILAELLPRIIPVSKEDIHVRRNPTFTHQKVAEFVKSVKELGMDVMLNQDDRIEIFDDDYRLVAFPHIFLFWNVLFFTNDGQHQYFSVLNSQDLLTVLKEENIVELLKQHEKVVI
jgi:hypothetical protein